MFDAGFLSRKRWWYSTWRRRRRHAGWFRQQRLFGLLENGYGYGKLIDDLKMRVSLCRFIGIVDLVGIYGNLWGFTGVYTQNSIPNWYTWRFELILRLGMGWISRVKHLRSFQETIGLGGSKKDIVFVIAQDIGKPGMIKLRLSCFKVDTAQSLKSCCICCRHVTKEAREHIHPQSQKDVSFPNFLN